MTFQESTEFDALWESMWKCKRGKMWKASVARFVTHGIEETLKLEDEIRAETYLPRKPHTFRLTYPKPRPCSSTHIRDRIVQRSLNDNVVYPGMTRSFVWDNMACQKGKGTTKAMDRLEHQMRRYFINSGGSREGWVLQCDVQGYYRNMSHAEARRCFERHLDRETVDHAMAWLQRQYPYDVGFEPGSQMVQILGISMLDPLDHFIKERLRARYYGRYMDDFYLISRDRAFLERCREEIDRELGKLGLHLHPKKTRIFPLPDGIKVLGFTFRLTPTGKVIRIIDPKNVKHERKKLARMARLVREGKMTRAKFDECYGSWKAHANLGNSYKLLRRMDAYVRDLMREDNMKIIRNSQPIGERHRIENTLTEAGNTAAVTSIAFVVLAEKGDIDEVTASEHPALFASWSVDVDYAVGQIREDEGELYKCVQAHRSQTDWKPALVPALWKKIGDPTDEWPEWAQPVGAHDSYMKDDQTSHNGYHWISEVDNNVWEPGVYGWRMAGT